MSDDRDSRPPDDDGARIFRAAIPGWQSVVGRRPREDYAEVIFAPGRGYLEGAILLAAVAILMPIAAAGAIACAVGARRAGNRRWLAALVASVWCGLLGLVVRGALGVGLVP